jgi:hypothetical protein
MVWYVVSVDMVSLCGVAREERRDCVPDSWRSESSGICEEPLPAPSWPCPRAAAPGSSERGSTSTSRVRPGRYPSTYRSSRLFCVFYYTDSLSSEGLFDSRREGDTSG